MVEISEANHDRQGGCCLVCAQIGPPERIYARAAIVQPWVLAVLDCLRLSACKCAVGRQVANSGIKPEAHR
jgi:hypothetical protein